jgi:ABC-2 type transport system permease protein
MIKIIKIFRNSIIRSKYLLILAVIFGIVLCSLYALIGSMLKDSISSIPVGVKDDNKSYLSKSFISYLEDDLNMEITQSPNRRTLDSDLVEKNISAIVVIPKNFDEAVINGDAEVLDVSYMGDYENQAFINGYLEGYIQSLKVISLAAGGDEVKFKELLKEQGINKINVKNIAIDDHIFNELMEENGLQLVFGFYLMLAFILALGFANLIFKDRKNGTFDRVRITSVNTVQYIIGMCISSVVCSLILLIPFCTYLVVKGSYIDIPVLPLYMISIMYSLIVVGLALMFAMWLNTNNSIIAAIVGVTTISCILGGAFFPLDYSPEFLQQLARITPQFWFMDTVDILVKGEDGSILANGAIMGMFALLFFVLAGVRFAGNRLRVA